MSESNISKVRIYIQNTGTETIDNFSYRYYFTTENGQFPCIQDYYTPNEQIILVPCGSGYYIQYTVNNANLLPGGLFPHSSGNIIGLHYNDWSNWDKTNDFSENMNANFAENQNIPFYYNGTKIYGNEPGTTSGSVFREMWTGVNGISTENIPLATTPQITGFQTNLDAPRNISNLYGARIRGYITAPLTGDYTFWIASDDCSKLYLSTDDNPVNIADPIASVTGYTSWMEWNKYSSQKSAVKSLVAGNRYYIEILHKDGDQDDNCSVGWIKPGECGSAPSEIVPSSVLTPYIPAVLPAKPTNLSTIAVSSHRIDINWTDASSNELGFRLEMKKEGDTFSEFVMITSNQTSYQVTGLIPETRYYFRIRSYNLTGNSDYTDSTSATTFAETIGKVTREVWTDISGTLVSNIPVSTPANIIDEISTLETPQQWSNYYGQRIRGYIIPQTTGTYYFWIASDDNSQLWLSPNSDPATKVMIASLSGYTNWHEWNKYSSQKSGPINLTAGVRYYVEVLHKEGNENDNLSVGWLTPGQGGSEPSEVIPSSVLSPYIVPSIPEAPDNLTATAISATQVDLTWRDNSNNENGFRIERASGSSSFIEIGTTSANATVFHDAGLSANTQYSYRIRSFNDLGNSEYTSTIPITTLDNGTIVPQAVGLNSFAVYSSESTILKERSLFDGGGAAGSNKMVEVFPEAIVNGNVISGGFVRLRSQATVNGLARAADSVVLHTGAVVTGIEEGASVAIVDIPQKNTIITGTEKITVSNGSNRILSPGYYNDITVESSCTLTVSGGLYTFSRFFLQPDAIVLLDITYSDMVDIEVSGDLEFSDSSKVIFKDKGYVPFIRFYTNDANMVRVGVEVELNGTLTAPHGEIHIYSGSQCEGAVYGKIVYIEPDVDVVSDEVVNQTEDNDDDGIPNMLEIVMGTNPDDSTDFIPIAIPSSSYIDNTGNVIISYDFSRYFSDYSFATNVKATFPAGSLTRSNIPLLITVRNEPGGSIAPFADSNYNVIGRYFDFLDGNSIVSGMSIIFDGPVPQTLSREDYVPFQWNDSTAKWEEVSDTLTSTNPVVFAAKKRAFSSKTIYFDGGYVYSNKYNSVLRFDIDVPRDTVAVTGVDVMVKYLDFTVNSSGDLKSYKTACDYDTVDTAFSYSGHLVCPGKMRILEFGLIFTDSGMTIDSCIYVCSLGVDVFTAQAVVMHSSFPVKQYLNYPDPANQVSLYFYPCAETFESVSFGDGRIVLNTNTSDTNVFTYEYYLKDHLGSTRMVINDQGSVTEAVAYHSYGTMVDIGSYSSAMPVREKFTGKEYDNEGEVNGVGGIDAYYFGARMYDPEVGIWLSTDPEDQYWNAYSYCGYDPINSIDATGQAAELIYELPKMVVTASRIGLTAAQAAAITTALTTMATLYLMYEIVKPVELGDATLTGNQYDWADQFEQNISLNENAQAGEGVQEAGKTGTVEDATKDTEPIRTDKKSPKQTQLQKKGKSGIGDANKEFDKLNPRNVQDKGGGVRTGELADGSKITVRPKNEPTIQIWPKSGGKPIEIRF